MSVICCRPAEAVTTDDARMTLIRCVMCVCSVYSVRY